MPSSNQTPRLSRGGDRRGPRPIGGRPGFSWLYGLALLLILGLAQMYWFVPQGKAIPYSEFKEYVKSGGVTEVVVGEQTIHGTLKNALPVGNRQTRDFTTARVDDPKLTEELEAQGVKYSGETNNRWLPELLGWVIPLVFFVAIWGFFFRRMSGAEGGVMSFARSRAKVFADDEVKVRFADVAGVDEVGRGCLAGPVVAAAVVLPEHVRIPRVGDSKLIPAAEREVLCERIIARALTWAVASVDPLDIDRLNIQIGRAHV